MNDAVEITPIAETTETVTLRRADYQALLEALEDGCGHRPAARGRGGRAAR